MTTRYRKNPPAESPLSAAEAMSLCRRYCPDRALHRAFLRGLEYEHREHGGGMDGDELAVMVLDHLAQNERYYDRHKAAPQAPKQNPSRAETKVKLSSWLASEYAIQQEVQEQSDAEHDEDDPWGVILKHSRLVGETLFVPTEYAGVVADSLYRYGNDVDEEYESRKKYRTRQGGADTKELLWLRDGAYAAAKKLKTRQGAPKQNPTPETRRNLRGGAVGTSGNMTIYRGCSTAQTDIEPMDYCTADVTFAAGHAAHLAVTEEEPQHVLSARVPKRDVYEAPNTGELFYDGPRVRGRRVLLVKPQ